MRIEAEKTDEKISVKSPYHSDLPAEAKKLGGRWNGESWTYDIRDEELVADMYRNIYGQWVDDDVATVTVRVTVNEGDVESDYTNGLYCCGRQVARAFGRDSGARQGDDIRVISGSGFGSGGSRKNWVTICADETIFEIRDVPQIKAQEEIDNPSNGWTVEIMGEIDHDALKAERKNLMGRVAEIDQLLNQ